MNFDSFDIKGVLIPQDQESWIGIHLGLEMSLFLDQESWIGINLG